MLMYVVFCINCKNILNLIWSNGKKKEMNWEKKNQQVKELLTEDLWKSLLKFCLLTLLIINILNICLILFLDHIFSLKILHILITFFVAFCLQILSDGYGICELRWRWLLAFPTCTLEWWVILLIGYIYVDLGWSL